MLALDPRIHDSYFMGSAILRPDEPSESRGIQLSFESDDGERFQVKLHGCESFRCDNFREGNIVFDLSDLNADEVSRDDIERLVCHDDVEYVRNLNEDGLTKDTEKFIDLIRSKEMKFVKMTSSYGAEFLALCKKAEIVEY